PELANCFPSRPMSPGTRQEEKEDGVALRAYGTSPTP
ncbi:MAG: hypothetical protein QOG36_1074, partial [Actinomycetota bacterium]|nr:hypothetical protein [Actinomycetota bacterium]